MYEVHNGPLKKKKKNSDEGKKDVAAPDDSQNKDRKTMMELWANPI